MYIVQLLHASLYSLYMYIHVHVHEKAVTVGPDKPVIPGQRLFRACYLSSAGNTHNLSDTPPGLHVHVHNTYCFFLSFLYSCFYFPSFFASGLYTYFPCMDMLNTESVRVAQGECVCAIAQTRQNKHREWFQ